MIPLLLALSLETHASAGPALVTTARGDVQLVTPQSAAAAPAPPFLLADGQSLKLGSGAVVVVLYEGTATQRTGPGSVDPRLLGTSAPVAGTPASALDDLLLRRASMGHVGAHRDARLERPLAMSSVARLQSVQWTECDGCTLHIMDPADGSIVWSTEVSPAMYTGPALRPGAWDLELGGAPYTFVVLGEAERQTLEAARAGADLAVDALGLQGVTDPSVLAAIPAAMYLEVSLPTEALYVLDAAIAAHPGNGDLLRVRAEFEDRIRGMSAP
jgi:hypothetical protein